MATSRYSQALSHLIPFGRLRAKILVPGTHQDPVTIEYFRMLKDSTVGRLRPDTCVRVRLEGNDSAPNLEAGKLLARNVLGLLEQGDLSFTEEPYLEPTKPSLCEVHEHPYKAIRISILKSERGFELSSIGVLPNGYSLPVSTPSLSRNLEFEWARLDLMDRLVADTLEEAQQAVPHELERLANSEMPIQTRDILVD